MTSGPDPATALESLAAALGGTAFAITFQGGRLPRITVTNRRAPQLTEDIYVENGWFFWGWGDKLGPVDGLDQAAGKIRTVLRAVGTV